MVVSMLWMIAAPAVAADTPTPVPPAAGGPPVPSITDVTPISGPITGGTVVTISGEGLGGPAGTVTFGGIAATNVSNPGTPGVTPNVYICTTPAHAAGTVDVVIINGGGTATKTAGFTFGSSSEVTVYTHLFGLYDEFVSNSAGVVQETFLASSTDGKLRLTIPAKTVAKNAAGTALATMTEDINNNPPAPLSGNSIGLAVDLGPSGATFTPPITFVYNYEHASFDYDTGGGEAAFLSLAFYDTQTATWVDLKQKYGADYVKIDGVNNIITALIPQFATYAVLVKTTIPTTSALPSPTTVTPSGTVAEIKPSPAPAPSSIPAPLPPASTAVSQPIPAQPPPSLSPSSVATVAAAESSSPAPDKATTPFNWALVIGIVVAAIVVIAVIMMVGRKGK